MRSRGLVERAAKLYRDLKILAVTRAKGSHSKRPRGFFTDYQSDFANPGKTAAAHRMYLKVLMKSSITAGRARVMLSVTKSSNFFDLWAY